MYKDMIPFIENDFFLLYDKYKNFPEELIKCLEWAINQVKENKKNELDIN